MTFTEDERSKLEALSRGVSYAMDLPTDKGMGRSGHYAAGELPGYAKMLVAAAKKNDTKNVRLYLSMVVGQAGVIAKHAGFEAESVPLRKLSNQLRRG